MLEIIRLEGHALGQEDSFVSRDVHLLQVLPLIFFCLFVSFLLLLLLLLSSQSPLFEQLCNGIDENAVGACSELIFAPIDDMFPEDAPLVPSGFRIALLNSQPVESCFFAFDFL